MSDETTTPTAEPPAPAHAGSDAAAAPPELPAHETPPAAPVADVVGAPVSVPEADHLPPAAEPEAAEAAETPPPTAEATEPEPADEEPVVETAAPEPAAEVEAEPEPAPAVAETPEPEPEPEAPAVIQPLAAVAAEAHAEPAVAGEVVADAPPAEAEPAAEAAAPAEPPPPESAKKWYVVKVQSNREESIKAAVERQVKIQGLEEFFGQIVIPTEEYYEKKKVSVKDKKTGQKVTEERNVTKHRKKYPGYLFAEVEFNDRILYVFRETSGVGDFVGATHHRAPSPMPDREVQQMLTGVAGPAGSDPKRKVKVKLNFEKGDKVRIREGAFSGSEAEVKAISEPKDPTDSPKVTVVVTIWGRPVEMEMDSFQVDKA